jgi:hypothetical protein
MQNEITRPQEPKQVLIFPVGFGKYDVVWGRIIADNLTEAEADAIISGAPPPPKPEPPQGTYLRVPWHPPDADDTDPSKLWVALSQISSALEQAPYCSSDGGDICHVGAEIDVPAFARSLRWHPLKVAALVRYWARQGEFKIVFAEGDIIRLTKINSEPLPRPAPKVEPPGQKLPEAGQKRPQVRQPAPKPEPDPAELQRQYDATLTDVERWQRDAQIHELGHLCQLRRRQCVIPRDVEFSQWCASIGIDPQRWYTSAALSDKVKLTLDEDAIFGTQALGRWPINQRIKHSTRTRTLRAERFPTRFYPLGETPKERKKRRRRVYLAMDRNNRKQRERKTMLNQETQQPVRTPPRLTKIEALTNALPRAPGRMKLVDAAAKVRQHHAWRDQNGKMLAVRTVRNKLRDMAAGCTSIGYEVVDRVAFLWRR